MGHEVPQDLIFAYSVVGMFVGDLFKKFGLSGWIPYVNAMIGGLLACWFIDWTLMSFIIGMNVGLAATGLHGVRKGVVKKVNGGGQ
jgi:hypothetical protein